MSVEKYGCPVPPAKKTTFPCASASFAASLENSFVKDIKKKGEAAKVAVRNVRRDANDTLKKMEKSTDITEDERKEGEEKIQKMTDKYVAKIDKSVENKSKEIMTV